ncbi:XdhC family protein [Chitinophaga rhizophila]|uniref:XdhC family protein n=1 Tax=Chitinophaga rhizophila TaxID=2866212 RepID=A0ABS7GC80_9BACT|nr:XdhC/CoxI family protein [Chitinophaga rhizophila]MBW8685282.1 XdhC family protein [Chitinophaga rhizophila]
MQKQLVTWELISKSLRQNVPVMLLYVLDSHGSSPGRRGFFMAVNQAGEIAGSIGGGIMEHKFVEMAREQLGHFATSYSIHQQYHDKAAARQQSGMICSGDQAILLYKLTPDSITPVNKIIACLSQHQQGILELSPMGLQFTPDIKGRPDCEYHLQSELDWYYKEKIGYQEYLYIVGGGHCSLALSEVARKLDFYVHIFEDRPQLHTLQQNTAAHEKTIVRDYSQLEIMIPSGEHHYVVIMTMGYRTDDIALRALLRKSFRYCGVLGSAAKIDKMFEAYQEEGIHDSLLSRLYAPVGIEIGSQTPEEIAVSIAAQLVQVRHQPTPSLLSRRSDHKAHQ